MKNFYFIFWLLFGIHQFGYFAQQLIFTKLGQKTNVLSGNGRYVMLALWWINIIAGLNLIRVFLPKIL